MVKRKHKSHVQEVNAEMPNSNLNIESKHLKNSLAASTSIPTEIHDITVRAIPQSKKAYKHP